MYSVFTSILVCSCILIVVQLYYILFILVVFYKEYAYNQETIHRMFNNLFNEIRKNQSLILGFL